MCIPTATAMEVRRALFLNRKLFARGHWGSRYIQNIKLASHSHTMCLWFSDCALKRILVESLRTELGAGGHRFLMLEDVVS